MAAFETIDLRLIVLVEWTLCVTDFVNTNRRTAFKEGIMDAIGRFFILDDFLIAKIAIILGVLLWAFGVVKVVMYFLNSGKLKKKDKHPQTGTIP